MDPNLFQYQSEFKYAETQAVAAPEVEIGYWIDAPNAHQDEEPFTAELRLTAIHHAETGIAGLASPFSSFLGPDRNDWSPPEKVNPAEVDLFIGFDATEPDFPTNPFAGAFAPIVSRDPKADPRSRNHDEKVQAILNSLIGRGEIVLIGPGLWRLNASIARTASRAPNANDDVNDGLVVGTIWVDTGTNAVYVLANNSAGAAVWTQVS